jgi:CheY-like chemotaxis protein
LARKILLADDSVTAQNMGRKILVDAGYDVLTVNNGSAALKRITETKPDLIILDVYMPGYSGLEVCQRLKDSPDTANIPVLLSVGKLEPFKPQEARRVRANAHIVKPFEASELLSAIARLEDCIVPQAHKPSFCSPLPTESEADERFASAESNPDFARKSGTRGSSKRKDRSDREPEEPVANFRDFRKVKARSATVTPESNETQETAIPELPSNITTEELDAISAVAAKLDEVVAAPEGGVSSIETAPGAVETALVQAARQASDDQFGVPAPSSSYHTGEAAATPASELEAAKSAITEMPPVTSAIGSSVTPANEAATTVEKTETVGAEVVSGKPKTDSSLIPVQSIESGSPELGTAEPQSSGSESSEVVAAPQSIPEATVHAEWVAQEAAPIDQQDEPIFASAAAAEDKTELKSIQAEERVAEVNAQETNKEETSQENVKPVEAVAQPIAVAGKHEEEPSAPTDEELAEALRLLTPSTANAGVTVISDHTDSSDPTSSFATQESSTNLEHVPAAHASSDASNGSRWMAEAIGLTPEEAAISLEAEMFRTFATAPASEVHAAPEISGASLITAAVESRLAERTETASEAVPKAMAAVAAATESGTSQENSTQPSEDNAIANIVEQVLADLRPKIVEEIAKKLGKNH